MRLLKITCLFFIPALLPARPAGEYLPVNIGELYIAMRGQGSRDPLQKRIVIRGKVYRHPKLTAAGTFALMRTAIVCCVLHANILGLKTRFTATSRSLPNGSWVKVYGRLVKKGGAPFLILNKREFHISGNPPTFAGIRTDHIFIPDRIVPIAKPASPWITKWHKKAPYSY